MNEESVNSMTASTSLAGGGVARSLTYWLNVMTDVAPGEVASDKPTSKDANAHCLRKRLRPADLPPFVMPLAMLVPKPLPCGGGT